MQSHRGNPYKCAQFQSFYKNRFPISIFSVTARSKGMYPVNDSRHNWWNMPKDDAIEPMSATAMYSMAFRLVDESFFVLLFHELSSDSHAHLFTKLWEQRGAFKNTIDNICTMSELKKHPCWLPREKQTSAGAFSQSSRQNHECFGRGSQWEFTHDEEKKGNTDVIMLSWDVLQIVEFCANVNGKYNKWVSVFVIIKYC